MQNSNLLNDGYVVDVPYPTFVHRQAMPVWLASLVQLKGNRAPDLSRPYRYLELGCAMGIHLHLTAAANPMGHFVGIDFNAQQLMVAEEGVDKTQISNLEFIQASFVELLSQELEAFDFIICHGVYSWVSSENQNALLQVIAKFLKQGGIVYCSYMSHPGATELSSIQKLMVEMSRNLQGDSATKAVQSLSLARKIGQSKIGLFAKVPSLNQTLAQLAQDKPNYIAHDFLSEHWQPQHSADMIRAFGKFNISYVTGAGISEHLDAIRLPEDIRKIIQNLPLVTLQETVRDIALHSLQRQDVYSHSRQRLTEAEQYCIYQSMQFTVLPQAPVRLSLKNDPKIGAIKDIILFAENILKELDGQQLSIQELAKKIKFNIQLDQLRDVVLLLIWAGYIHPINPHIDEGFMEATNAWMTEQQLPWQVIPLQGTAVETH